MRVSVKALREKNNEMSKAVFKFVIDIPKNGFFSENDISLFSHIVGNLLTNATKYNDTGSAIYVRLTANDKLTLEIADND